MDSIRKIFKETEWREELDPEIKRKLEKILKRVKSEEEAYKNSKYESTAQIWVGMAELFSRIDRLDRRLKRIEKALGKVRREEKHLKDVDLEESLKKY